MTLDDLKKHPAFRSSSLADIAAVCGVTRQAIHRWKQVSPRCCPAIESYTKKVTPDQVLTCEELRPDIDFIREPPVTGLVVKYCVRIKKKDD